MVLQTVEENSKIGEKLNEEFEAQIWGNLLQCAFEDRNEYFDIYSSLPI